MINKVKEMVKDYTHLVFKGKSDLLDTYKKLVLEAHVMDSILHEIKNLKRGKVYPRDTKRRARVGSYFSSEAQQILYYLQPHKVKVGRDVTHTLRSIISKGEAILRENIVLQSTPPFDVIKQKNVPIRYAHNPLGKKERRYGYGLHKFTTTEQGYSVTLAHVPPRHIQVFHTHSVSEYVLLLDGKTFGFANPENMRRKITGHKNEILYFASLSAHTISNPNRFVTRNVTVKSPTGVLDWKPFLGVSAVKTDHSKVITGTRSRLAAGNGTKTTFSIHDAHHCYTIEVTEFNKDTVIKSVFRKDRYIFVVAGNLLLSRGRRGRRARENDYIVIDKNTSVRMNIKAKTRLYTVNIQKKSPS